MDAFVDAATQNVLNMQKQYKDTVIYGKKVAKSFAFELETGDVSELLKLFNDF